MEEFLVVVVCLLLNAVFAAVEMAFVSAPKSELRVLAKKENAHAKILLMLREKPERTLSVIQIGITLVGAVAAAVGGAGAADSLEPYLISRFHMREVTAEIVAILAVVVPISYFSVVVGELVPKSLALRNSTSMALKAAPALVFFDRALFPIVSLLERSTRLILKIFPKVKRNIHAVPASIEIDTLSPTHQRIVVNAAEIEQKKVRDMMVPWSEVTFVNDNASAEELAMTVLQSGHTRLPVVSGDQVVGILHAKEFMAFREAGDKNWHSIVRPPIMVRPNNLALGILRQMQEKRSHLAVVISSGMTPEGIMTLEDILEELVGDINDEDDDGRVQKTYIAKARARRLFGKR